MAKAILHGSTDPPPVAIALDTSFVVKVLNGRDPQNTEALEIYRRLASDRVVCAVCRPVLRLEFWFAWTRAVRDLTHDELGRLAREARESLRGQRELGFARSAPPLGPADRSARLAEGEHLLDVLLSHLRVTNVRLTDRLLTDARDEIVRWGLKPLDAVILAVAETVADTVGGAPHLATMDDDFRKVDGLPVWGIR